MTSADLARELGVHPARIGSDTDTTAAEATEAAAAGDAATTTAPAADEQDAAAAGAAEGTETEPAAAEGEQGEEQPEEQAEDPKVPEKAQKAFEARIGELTAKRKEAETRATTAEERATRAEQRLAEIETARERGTTAALADSADDLSDALSADDLATRERQVQSAKDWAIRHPDGGTIDDGNGGQVEISAEQARAVLANSERTLAAIPRRREFIAERAKATEAAKAAYPWLYDHREVQAQQELAQIRRNFAGKRVSDLPDFDIILGDAIVGQSVRDGHYRLVPVAKPPAGAKPAAGSVSVPSAAPKVAPAPKRITSASATALPGKTVPAAKKQALDRLRRTGSVDDLAAALG